MALTPDDILVARRAGLRPGGDRLLESPWSAFAAPRRSLLRSLVATCSRGATPQDGAYAYDAATQPSDSEVRVFIPAGRQPAGRATLRKAGQSAPDTCADPFIASLKAPLAARKARAGQTAH